jgi:hypothetical protein
VDYVFLFRTEDATQYTLNCKISAMLVSIRWYIQKCSDWVDNEVNNSNKHSLRSNTKSYGGKTHKITIQLQPSCRKLYNLQLSLQAVGSETFGYTLICGITHIQSALGHHFCLNCSCMWPMDCYEILILLDIKILLCSSFPYLLSLSSSSSSSSSSLVTSFLSPGTSPLEPVVHPPTQAPIFQTIAFPYYVWCP